MKTNYKLILALIFTCLFSLNNFAQLALNSHDKAIERCLQVKFQPVCNKEPVGEVSVKLYQGNKVIDLFNTRNLDSRRIILKKNQHYTVEICKKGYYPRLVSIDTNLPEDMELENGFFYEYDMKVEFIKELRDVKTYYVDFPVALIAYDEYKDEFNHIKKYTRATKKEVMLELSAGVSKIVQ